jgi:hypothetical protein
MSKLYFGDRVTVRNDSSKLQGAHTSHNFIDPYTSLLYTPFTHSMHPVYLVDSNQSCNNYHAHCYVHFMYPLYSLIRFLILLS